MPRRPHVVPGEDAEDPDPGPGGLLQTADLLPNVGRTFAVLPDRIARRRTSVDTTVLISAVPVDRISGGPVGPISEDPAGRISAAPVVPISGMIGARRGIPVTTIGTVAGMAHRGAMVRRRGAGARRRRHRGTVHCPMRGVRPRHRSTTGASRSSRSGIRATTSGASISSGSGFRSRSDPQQDGRLCSTEAAIRLWAVRVSTDTIYGVPFYQRP